MLPLIVVFLGAIANIAGSMVYLRDTLKGTTKPNRVTWLLWSAAPLIAVGASLAHGDGWTVVPVLGVGLASLMIFVASLINKNAYWELHFLDYLCGFLSVIALILWLITKEPELAITFAIIADALAALPTIVKAWKHPETETSINYFISGVSALSTILVISTWNYSAWAFPAYLVFVDFLLFFLIIRKRFRRV